MKPTKLQIILAKIVKECAEDWIITNDINSPSHWNLIDENVERAIDDIFFENIGELELNQEDFKDKICDLLTFIRKA